MTLKQASKIAKLAGLMMIVRDELEELQSMRLLPKRLNSRTNSWLADANDLLDQVLDTDDKEVHEQLLAISQVLEYRFNEVDVK